MDGYSIPQAGVNLVVDWNADRVDWEWPSTDYLESLKKPNVTPVHESITEITPSDGIMLDDSKCRDDTNLAEVWEKKSRSYLGVAAHGFPNYVMLLGPNSPLAKSPLIKEDVRALELRMEVAGDFMEQKDIFMKTTIWENDCRSWFKNANTEAVAIQRFEDFHVIYTTKNQFAYLGNGFRQTQL
ncbi:hypothetical protein BDV27DRAFT_158268 [Aspergillus caelatus]|uniref:Uncharacterized protein n=1 Tax=Aspergillus caelatus TaxID=61420 RepID=A0A5N7A3E5_9EURO|nr:uncharacterized protein BDV27DRAFT_158268 [Aspergillus caelatus]KAE8363958.1 hypothetical protein BDV27DRAFT_158268 [Aspergillus caelatus]